MRIESIEAVVVHVPRRRAFGGVYASALGAADVSEHVMVRVRAGGGLTGFGEVANVFGREGAALKRAIDAALAPALIGEDARRIAHLAARMDEALAGAELAKAGLEMALFDIRGKALGVPVYELLGGLVRERVPLSFSVPFGTPEQMAAFAAARVAEGFRTVKVKAGRDAESDHAAVAAVRDAVGPRVRVRVDANMGWRTVENAVAMIERIAPFAIELIEQPLARHDLAGLAEVRRRTSVPVLADESVWTPADAMAVIRHEAADAVNVYVTESGGLMAAARTFAICEAAGVGCMIGSMPELGPATAAQIHLGVAMTNLAYDSDTCGVLYHEDDLLKTPLRIEGGYAYPPTGPGLGVNVDWRLVESRRMTA